MKCRWNNNSASIQWLCPVPAASSRSAKPRIASNCLLHAADIILELPEPTSITNYLLRTSTASTAAYGTHTTSRCTGKNNSQSFFFVLLSSNQTNFIIIEHICIIFFKFPIDYVSSPPPSSQSAVPSQPMTPLHSQSPQHLSPTKHALVSPPTPSSYHPAMSMSPVTVQPSPTATHLLTTVTSPMIDKMLTHHYHHHHLSCWWECDPRLSSVALTSRATGRTTGLRWLYSDAHTMGQWAFENSHEILFRIIFCYECRLFRYQSIMPIKFERHTIGSITKILNLPLLMYDVRNYEIQISWGLPFSMDELQMEWILPCPFPKGQFCSRKHDVYDVANTYAMWLRMIRA